MLGSSITLSDGEKSTNTRDCQRSVTVEAGAVPKKLYVKFVVAAVESLRPYILTPNLQFPVPTLNLPKTTPAPDQPHTPLLKSSTNPKLYPHYMYIYIYIERDTQICTYLCTNTYVHTCYVCKHIHERKYIRTYVIIYRDIGMSYIHRRRHRHGRMHIHIHMHLRLHLHLPIRLHMHIHPNM